MDNTRNKSQYYQKQVNGRCMAIVFVLLLATSIYLYITNASVRAATTTVEAEITQIEYLYAYGDKEGKEIEGVTSLTAAYEFDGVAMETQIEGGNPIWVVGDSIWIALDKNDPTIAQYPADNMIATAMLIGAVLSGAVATYSFIGVSKIKKRQRMLEEEAERRKQEEEANQEQKD